MIKLSEYGNFVKVNKYIFHNVRRYVRIIINFIYNSMIYKTLLLSTLFVLALTYDITIACGPTGCPSSCKNCQTIDGGPFKKITECVDNQGGCSSIGSSTISLNCGGCGSDCSYKIS